MKKIGLSLSALLLFASQVIAVNYSSTAYTDSLKSSIVVESVSSATNRATRTLTPVNREYTEPNAINDQDGIVEQQVSGSSQESVDTMAEVGSTTKIFGGNTQVTSMQTKTASVKISTAGTPPAAAGKRVAGVCGRPNFDDAVKSTYGKISLTDTYIDSGNNTCVLGKKDLYVRKIFKRNSSFMYSSATYDTGWVHFGQNHYIMVTPTEFLGSAPYEWKLFPIATEMDTKGCTYKPSAWDGTVSYKHYQEKFTSNFGIGRSFIITCGFSSFNRYLQPASFPYTKVETLDPSELWFK